MTAPESIREQIRKALADAKITQRELARRAGMHQPNLSDYLRKPNVDITTKTADRILAVLAGLKGKP